MNKRSATVKQIQRLDDIAINSYGIPSIVLMENAGKAVALEIKKLLAKTKKPNVMVFCGLGNNAGDGFVVARHLSEMNCDVKIVMLGTQEKLKKDPYINYSIAKKLKVPVKNVQKVARGLVGEIQKADLIVDAIFGVGLNRDIKGFLCEVIDVINVNASKVISVDIPSGLDGTTGKIYGTCIKASKTVTFSLIKKGMLLAQGVKLSGKVVVADIGIPEKLIEKVVRGFKLY